jgi:hypothetical protein
VLFYWVGGGVGVRGSGFGGMQLRHVVFTLEDGFEDSVRLYCMFVIQLMVFTVSLNT